MFSDHPDGIDEDSQYFQIQYSHLVVGHQHPTSIRVVAKDVVDRKSQNWMGKLTLDIPINLRDKSMVSDENIPETKPMRNGMANFNVNFDRYSAVIVMCIA